MQIPFSVLEIVNEFQSRKYSNWLCCITSQIKNAKILHCILDLTKSQAFFFFLISSNIGEFQHKVTL